MNSESFEQVGRAESPEAQRVPTEPVSRGRGVENRDQTARIARRARDGATSRLARGVFIGRTAELSTLHGGVDDALAGRGRVFLVEGQAGIGKTSLARQVGSYAESRGLRVVWGRCHETSGAPAYWPWIQVVRSCVADSPEEDFRADLPVDAEVMARVVPSVAERLGRRLAAPGLGHEEARFRFFDAIVLYLTNVARRQPFSIVLDDLQWADRSSLLLLQFLAREVMDSRLAVLCCYRDAELASDATAAKVIAELRREATTLHLRGLSEDEVRAQVRAISDPKAAAGCACVRTIFRRTDGNPFFVGEILRHLLEEGIVYHNGEGWRSQIAPDAMHLPDSVRELVGRRLGHVSETCRQLLSTASVLGREFRLDIVAHLTDLPGDRVGAVLEEALRARIVAQTPGPVGEYVFCHPMVQETLYTELPALQRADLHKKAGEHLETVWSGEIDLHAAELARHFLRTATPDLANKATEYALRAAARARGLMAHEEAASNYELALQAIDVTQPGQIKLRGELLIKASESWWRAAETERARRAALQAVELFRQVGDSSDLARAALTYAGQTPGLGAQACDQSVVRILEEALSTLGKGESELHARVMGRLAEGITLPGDRDRRHSLAKQAVEMARRLGDSSVLASVLKNTQWGLWMPEKFQQRLTLADEVVQLAGSANDASAKFDAHLFRFFAKLELAEMPAAQEEFSACTRWASELRQPFSSWIAAAADVCRAFALGRLDDAEKLIDKALLLGEKAQGAHASLFRVIQLAHLHWLRGCFEELPALYEKLEQEYPALRLTLECASTLSLCEQGRSDEAREQLERIARNGFAQLRRDTTRMQNVTFLAQVCAALRDASAATQLYELLRPFDGRVIVFAPVLVWGPASHFLGLLAATAGRVDLAKRHFEDALATNARMGTIQWLARTQLAYAQLLVETNANADRTRAIDLLEQSARTSNKLKMQVTAEQARAALRYLEAEESPPARIQRVSDEDGDELSRSKAVARQDKTDASSTNVFRCEGSYWTILYEGKCIRLPNRKGLKLISILLAHPDQEFHVLRLVELIEGLDPEGISGERLQTTDPTESSVEGGLGPLLDERAKREYAKEIASLKEQLEEAHRFKDAAKASALRERLKWFADQLSDAVGRHGKDRPVRDPAERARTKVRKNFKAALDAIRNLDKTLCDYLKKRVRTGRFCSYNPDPDRDAKWTIE